MALDWDAAQAISAGTSDEPLVPVLSRSEWIAWPIYFKQGVQGALPEIWLRQSLHDRLLLAADALPSGYRLVVLDGWRPKSLQQKLFADAWAKIASDNPSLSKTEIESLVRNYVAPASDDPKCPSPHITGGAVDVTLADSDCVFCEMGSLFDEVTEQSWTNSPVSETASDNRRCLLEAMQRAGFTNLPSEWWHFDFGNWLWALSTNQTSAIYGPIKQPFV